MSQTVLSDNIAALVAGTITTAAFEDATSPAALQTAVKAALLPGVALTEEKPKSKAVAVGLGVGLGLGVPCVAAGAFAAWWLMTGKAAKAGGGGLAAPMLA